MSRWCLKVVCDSQLAVGLLGGSQVASLEPAASLRSLVALQLAEHWIHGVHLAIAAERTSRVWMVRL